jgi:hypothetical protein
MHVAAGAFALALLAFAVADAFQTVVVARHAWRLSALTRIFYRATWTPFAIAARLLRSERQRDRYLGLYGPLSLLLLLGLWGTSLIIAFALLQWSIELRGDRMPLSFADDIYFSAATFFTLGAGVPHALGSKYLMVLEAGFGFSFLGLVIGYLPVLYQSFSSRELRILLLDARAGSPPSAVQFMLRHGADPSDLGERLADWEEWALDLLQNHLSYPMLAYYRSQHPNQSWLAALTAVVDVSALAMLGANEGVRRQAQFSFAAGRHALVHTASIFHLRPHPVQKERLPGPDFSRLCSIIDGANTFLLPGRITEPELARLRSMYEPCANALAEYFLMALPPWIPGETQPDNWQISSWHT